MPRGLLASLPGLHACAAAALLAILPGLPACGDRGDPEPPRAEPPPADRISQLGTSDTDPATPSQSAGSVSGGGSDEGAGGESDETFTVIGVGDLMMAKLAQSRIRKEGNEYPFARIAPVLESHDVAFANLEAPISDRGSMRGKKKYHFRVDPDIAQSLRNSGIDVVSLANNHAMDYGEEALLDTITHLDGMQIAHSGAGGDLSAATAPAIFERGGVEIAFLSFCAWTLSGIHARDDRAGVAPMIEERVVKDVRALVAEGKIVIVSLHWGRQHTDHASVGQVKLAHAIIDAGASAIFGHHTHRPAELEVYKGKVIAYSLGNFLFGYYNPVYLDTFALALEFKGRTLKVARVLPIAGRNARIHFQPRLLEGKEARALLARLGDLSFRFGTELLVEHGGKSATVEIVGP